MRFAFIDTYRDQYPVELMCRVLKVSRSGYYAWRKREPSKRKMANQKLLALIKEIHQQSKGRYGSPRIYQALLALGYRYNRKRIARLMRQHGIQGKRPRRHKVTTDSNHRLPVAPNLLQQQFKVQAPNRVWCGDITYIATRQGWLYLAVVIDLFSRRVVGWSMRTDLTRQLVIDALQMALRRRRPPVGLIHHSDRGSQYASGDFQAVLAANGIRPSMSGKGNCFDNAPVESWFASLKTV
jgi:transposase InsO family protein